jgi:hypothetical protein
MRSSFFLALAFLLFLPTIPVRAEKQAARRSFLPLDDMTEILTDLRGLSGIGVGRVSAWDGFRKQNRIPSLQEMKNTQPESVEQEMAALGYVIFLPSDVSELLGVPRGRVRYSGLVDDNQRRVEFAFLYGDFAARDLLKRFPKVGGQLAQELGLVELPEKAVFSPLDLGSRSNVGSRRLFALALSDRMLVLIEWRECKKLSEFLKNRPIAPLPDFLELARLIRPKDAVAIFERRDVSGDEVKVKRDENGEVVFEKAPFPQTPILHCFQTCGILISKTEFLLGETEAAAREIARLRRETLRKKATDVFDVPPDPRPCVEGIPDGEWFNVSASEKLVRILWSPRFVRHDYLEGWN